MILIKSFDLNKEKNYIFFNTIGRPTSRVVRAADLWETIIINFRRLIIINFCLVDSV